MVLGGVCGVVVFVCNYVFVILNTFMVLELRSFVLSDLYVGVYDTSFYGLCLWCMWV